ncbi:MAG: hypothetical protein ACM3KR_03290 [Deltaproteobacteria bacterium]
MNQYAEYIVIIGAIVGFAGVFSYIKDTLKGTTKPNKVTWLLWSVAPLIAAFAAVSDGVRWSALPVFVCGFGPLLVFIASFMNKNAYWKLEKFDYVCGSFSVVALVLWAITKEPTVAIVFSIISDGSAAVPTLVKAWKYPETETPIAYIAGLFNALTSFVAIKVWNFSSCAFPVYLVIVCCIFIICLYKGKIFPRCYSNK